MIRFFYHPLTVIVITILASVFFFSLDKSGKRTEISTENIQSMEEEIHQASEEVLDLENAIIEVDTDEYKEKTIRNELLKKKENEQIIQLPELPEEDQTMSEVEERKEPINQWKELLNL